MVESNDSEVVATVLLWLLEKYGGVMQPTAWPLG